MKGKKLKYPYLTEIPSLTGRYVVLDTETTGLFCDSNHILEVAAIEIENGFLTGNQFHAYLKPRKLIEKKALEKHNISISSYAHNHEPFYESDKKIMEKLSQFIGDSLVFAHNAPFDLQFLNYELSYWSLPEIPEENFRCTLRIFKSLFNNSSFQHDKGHTLSGCCQFFNIKFESKNLHTAVYDATLTAKLVNCFYEFLEKNPEYLSKKVISNVSYLEAKRDLGNFNQVTNKNKNKENTCVNSQKVEHKISDENLHQVQVKIIRLSESKNDQQEENTEDKVNNIEAHVNIFICEEAKSPKINKNKTTDLNNGIPVDAFSQSFNDKNENNQNKDCFVSSITESKNVNVEISCLSLIGVHLDNQNPSNENQITEVFCEKNKSIGDSTTRKKSEILDECTAMLSNVSLTIEKIINENNIKKDSNIDDKNNFNINFESSFKAKRDDDLIKKELNLQSECDFKISQIELKETQLKTKQENVDCVNEFNKQEETQAEKIKENNGNPTALNDSSENESSEKDIEIDYLDNESSEIHDFNKSKKLNLEERKLHNTEYMVNHAKKDIMNSEVKAKTNKINLEQLKPKLPVYKKLMKTLLMRENLN